MQSYTAHAVRISHLAEKQKTKVLDCTQPCCREKATIPLQLSTSDHVIDQRRLPEVEVTS
ncbi:MAG: hypothetical protein H7A55_18435 [Verrucomicrobiaceae bacterium]|nr:hypothetical protein [Verrucomicrobiaceae bacterium]